MFVCEAGRWNFRRAVEAGGLEYELMRRQISKGLHRVLKAANGDFDGVEGFDLLNNEDLPDGIVWVLDMEGFDYFQMASPRSKT